MSDPETTSCIGNDPGCPCQDGDACHYRDIPGSPGWPVKEKPNMTQTTAEPHMSFTIRCSGQVVARVSGPWEQAEREADRYARQYASEGPVKVIRRPIRGSATSHG